MAHPLDPSLLGSLALAGLALCLAFAGWVFAYRAGMAPVAVVVPPARPPRQLGPYTLADKIGEGAMGEVYRAWNAAVGGWRAVKLLPRGASERDRRRFEQEARLGAELRHRNTVSIYDSGEAHDGTCYYAMELLDGVTLHELVEREGRQPPARVVRILLQLCAALEEAHGKGLVHRDIKPENVLLTRDGLCKLIDFGLAERVGEGAEGQVGDAVVGTPLYISPEAIVAPETVGARSDLYGVGAVAYFLLRGAPVFHGRSVVEVCGHHLHTAPERLSAVLGDAVPAELEQIVLDCLAKDAAQRPASAAELSRRLASCARALARRRSLHAAAAVRGARWAAVARTAVDARAVPPALDALGVADTLAVSGVLGVADTLRAGDAASGALPRELAATGSALGAPLCLAFMRAQRAFERLDAVLAAREPPCPAAA
ncbi:MAG TPA: serine/threonine-protein kinase [Polyangiaceae bacterium]|nr:serine/threonine-protein kinase [Polyangiaceae bacterium]